MKTIITAMLTIWLTTVTFVQAQQPATRPPIVNVKMSDGPFVPAGGAGPLPGDSSRYNCSLAIEIFNTTGTLLKDVQVKCLWFKNREGRVSQIVSWRVWVSDGLGWKGPYLQNSLPNIDIKHGERKWVIVEGYIDRGESGGVRQSIYGGIYQVQPRQGDDLYGYIVELNQGQKKIAEKLLPSSIRQNAPPARMR